MPVTQKTETTIKVEFDDPGNKKTLQWIQENELPEEAKKIVQVNFFDGTKLVFSCNSAVAEYFTRHNKVAQFPTVQKMDEPAKTND